jgi:tRNA U34 2-thiouridine synthase MnmA/TrmU
LDIDYIATGHYAKIIKKNNPKEIYKIIKAKDKNKDQTYFFGHLIKNY